MLLSVTLALIRLKNQPHFSRPAAKALKGLGLADGSYRYEVRVQGVKGSSEMLKNYKDLKVLKKVYWVG